MKRIDNDYCRNDNKRAYSWESGYLKENRKSYIIIEEKGQIHKRPEYSFKLCEREEFRFFEPGGKDFDGAFAEVVGLAVGEKVYYNRR